ncbi:MAG: hypothetical protein II695_08660, partial [Oscillospiraceae bacterium]|nr:hypothetical protein [Oscillospiraceae bacterium]
MNIEITMTIEQKIKDIENRKKIIRSLSYEENYTSWENFDISLIEKYIKLLNFELENIKTGYLIYNIKYANFTITIYPLDIEGYGYDKLFLKDNLGFINFTEVFPNFINYEINKNCLILVILLESQINNSAINDLNYYFYNFYEGHDNGLTNIIKIKDNPNLIDQNKQLQVIYPIKNEYKLNNGKNFLKIFIDFKKYNINLLNIEDPFYNNICFDNEIDKEADMTINDRRNEYYNDIKLCENSCTFENLRENEDNPKSLCKCNIKYKFSFDNQSGEKKTISEKNVPNIKAITCIKKLFNKDLLLSNINFWICLFIIVFQLFILFNACYKGKKEIYKKLGLKEKNVSFPPKRNNLGLRNDDNGENLN